MEKQGPIQKIPGANPLTPNNITKRKLVGNLARVLQERISHLTRFKDCTPKNTTTQKHTPSHAPPRRSAISGKTPSLADCPADDKPAQHGVKRKPKPPSQKKTPPIDPFTAVDILLGSDPIGEIDWIIDKHSEYLRWNSKRIQYLVFLRCKMNAFHHEIEKIEKVAKREAKGRVRGLVGDLEEKLAALKKEKELRIKTWDELQKIPKSLKSTAARVGAFLGTFGITSTVLYKVLKSGVSDIFGPHAGIAALGALGLLSFIANQPIMAMISNKVKSMIEGNYNKNKMEIRKEMGPKIERAKREMTKMVDEVYVPKIEEKLITFARSVFHSCELKYPHYLKYKYPGVQKEEASRMIRKDIARYVRAVYETINFELEAPAKRADRA